MTEWIGCGCVKNREAAFGGFILYIMCIFVRWESIAGRRAYR